MPVAEQAAQQVGAAQERAVGGVAPPRTIWLPPPVPVCRPSSMNFSVASRDCRASSYRVVVLAPVRPSCGRVNVDFDDAGIGRDPEMQSERGSWGGVVPFDLHRHAEIAGRRFDRGDQFEVIFEVLLRRHEDVQAAVPRFDAQRGPHQSRIARHRRGLGELR